MANMNGLIKETGSTQSCQPRAAGSVVQRAGVNYGLRNVTQTSVKVPNELSAYAGLQLACEEKGLKVVHKSFPLNVILTKWAALLKLKTSSEIDVSVSAVLLTGRCLKFELFSYFCLKNRGWRQSMREGNWKPDCKRFSQKENYVESEKVSTVFR